MEFDQETNEETTEKNETEQAEPASMKQWFQDNLRIIVSIIIVVLIAGGIYSYSNRSMAPANDESAAKNDVLSEAISGDSDASTSDNQARADSQSKDQAVQQKNSVASSVAAGTSKETDSSFIETAGKGDGTTKLARRALADYLEKNPDSTLTAEHKIYIEDYMRKNVGTGKVNIGSSVEFSKSLIGDAISKSKNLNAAQLKNLHKYAVRVPSLS
ncbi:MAG: hypothetical protein HGB08_01350 [Candidatus Moranbacteria bacterium]|nr:hypothetical protein [Candidatus Moranbacteria bacterium]